MSTPLRVVAFVSALAAVPAPAEEAPAEGHTEKRQRVKAAK